MAMYVVKYYSVETGHYQGQKACNSLKQAINASIDTRACGTDDTVVMYIDDKGREGVVPEGLIAASWS